MERRKTVKEDNEVCKDVTQEFSYESYVKWKTEAPYRSICSSKEMENYDMNLARISIRLMKKMNMKICCMWNSAGGLLAFNSKDFHVMVTEHYWASCYKNLFRARDNFEKSWKQKCETIYVCPNIFNVQDTSEKVLKCLSTSLEYLKELESLLLLHNQKPETATELTEVLRTPILGIDKARPVYWTVSHDIVYFQICNCYVENIIKGILQRMDNLFLLLRAADTNDFWAILTENSKSKSSAEQRMLNEFGKIISKPRKMKLSNPSLQTISEELPIRLSNSSVTKLFRKLKSHSRYSSADTSFEDMDARIGNCKSSKNFLDTSAIMSMEPLISDGKYSSQVLPVTKSGKLEDLTPKKEKFRPVINQMPNGAKLLRFGRRPIAYIMQKIRKNAKSFDSISVAKMTIETKGLI